MVSDLGQKNNMPEAVEDSNLEDIFARRSTNLKGYKSEAERLCGRTAEEACTKIYDKVREALEQLEFPENPVCGPQWPSYEVLDLRLFFMNKYNEDPDFSKYFKPFASEDENYLKKCIEAITGETIKQLQIDLEKLQSTKGNQSFKFEVSLQNQEEPKPSTSLFSELFSKSNSKSKGKSKIETAEKVQLIAVRFWIDTSLAGEVIHAGPSESKSEESERVSGIEYDESETLGLDGQGVGAVEDVVDLKEEASGSDGKGDQSRVSWRISLPSFLKTES